MRRISKLANSRYRALEFRALIRLQWRARTLIAQLAVGGLNLVFFDLKLRGHLAGVRTRRWCNLWRKVKNILYTPFEDASVMYTAMHSICYSVVEGCTVQ